MSYPIEEIEGIGAAFGDKFEAAGVKTTDDLLAKAAGPGDRKALAEATGLSDGQILKFANRADLMRVNGVGKQFAELMECAGVDIVPELAQRNSANLAKTMGELNDEKKLCKTNPTADQVAKWVEQAKGMDRALSY